MKQIIIWLGVILLACYLASVRAEDASITFTQAQLEEVAKEAYRIGYGKGVEDSKDTCFINWRWK